MFSFLTLVLLSVAGSQAQYLPAQFVSDLKHAGIKVVVWDMDLTLLTIHTHGAPFSVQEAQNQVAAYLSRDALEAISALQTCGLVCAVATRSSTSPESIQALLAAGGIADVDHIQAFNAVPKTLHLYRLIREIDPTLVPGEVVLIDDDRDNLEVVKQVGFQTYWVSGQKGFQWEGVVLY